MTRKINLYSFARKRFYLHTVCFSIFFSTALRRRESWGSHSQTLVFCMVVAKLRLNGPFVPKYGAYRGRRLPNRKWKKKSLCLHNNNLAVTKFRMRTRDYTPGHYKKKTKEFKISLFFLRLAVNSHLWTVILLIYRVREIYSNNIMMKQHQQFTTDNYNLERK